MHKKIDVMIVGAQKAGTTSLLRYLGEHPDCISHPQKEFSFFTDKAEYEEGLNAAFRKYYSHEHRSDATRVIAKNAGLYTRPECLQRLREHNPDCLIVYILRNPVERTYSSYLMEKHAGAVKFSFTDLPALMKQNSDPSEKWGFSFFINYSLYAKHLTSIYQFFPKENVLIFLYEDLKQNPDSLCRAVYERLNVDTSFRPDFSVLHNVTRATKSSMYARALRTLLHNENPVKKMIKMVVPGHKVYKYGDMLREVNKTNRQYEVIDPETKNYLIDFYKPHNQDLGQMLGRDFSAWNK